MTKSDDPPVRAPAPSAAATQGWARPPVLAPDPANPWTSPPGTAPPPVAARPRPSSGISMRRLVRGGLLPTLGLIVVIAVLVSSIRACGSDKIKTSIDNVLANEHSVITLSGSASVLPGDGPAQVLVITQDTDNKKSVTKRQLTKLTFANGTAKRSWSSEALADDTSRAEVAEVGGVLFAGVEDRLLALDASTGKTKWRTTLRDKVTLGCPSCFAEVDGHLVVRTTDAYVTAFGTASGEPEWSRRMVSPSGSISVVGDHLFVIDDPEDPRQRNTAQVVDPATGKTTLSTSPTCPTSATSPWDLELSPGDRILAVPGSSDVVAAFGFGDGCVVRWNPDTGTASWATRLPGTSSFQNDQTVIGPKDLVLPSTGSELVTISLADGQRRTLQGPADSNVLPNTILGRTLIADTSTTRGTPHRGLLAWDLSTGEKRWDERLSGDPEPVSRSAYHGSDSLFDGASRSLLVPGDASLTLMTFEGAKRTFSSQTVDPATGDLGTQVRRAFLSQYDSGTPSLTIEGFDGQAVILSIDSLIQRIPASGRGELASYPAVD